MNELYYGGFFAEHLGWNIGEIPKRLALRLASPQSNGPYLGALNILNLSSTAPTILEMSPTAFQEWVKIPPLPAPFIFGDESVGGVRNSDSSKQLFSELISAENAQTLLRLAAAKRMSNKDTHGLRALIIGSQFGAVELMLAQMGYEVTSVTPESALSDPGKMADLFIEAGVAFNVLTYGKITMPLSGAAEFIQAAAQEGKKYDFIFYDGSQVRPTIAKEIESINILLAEDGIANFIGPLVWDEPFAEILKCRYSNGKLLFFAVMNDNGSCPLPSTLMFAINRPDLALPTLH